MTTKSKSDAAPAAAEEQVVKEEPVTAIVVGHPKDRGEWKFRPWKGHDHWVNERTKVSTFNPKDLI